MDRHGSIRSVTWHRGIEVRLIRFLRTSRVIYVCLAIQALTLGVALNSSPTLTHRAMTMSDMLRHPVLPVANRRKAVDPILIWCATLRALSQSLVLRSCASCNSLNDTIRLP